MVWFRSLFCMAMVSLVFAAPAQATYLTLWSETPTVSDADDVGILAGQDIFPGAWHQTDAVGNDYFRIDLESAPGTGNFAGVYGIWIDTGLGGAPADHEYTPGAPGGVDIVLDIHYQPTLGYFKADYHLWAGSDFTTTNIDLFKTTENGGTTLEFQQDLGGATIVDWCAVSYDLGSETGFYDTTGTCVPEPSTILLVVMGFLGMIFYRGRR